MTRPMFVFDSGGDLMVVGEDRPDWFEEIDVAAGEYKAFTIDGQVVEVAIRDGAVVFVPTGRSDLPGLLEQARRYAANAGVQAGEDDFLLALANREQTWLWERRWPKRPRWLARRIHGEGPPPPFSRE